jgi:tripartite ATP-independent transporter DctM subunit
MKRDGYDPRFSVALTATSACLGNLIPPSLFMILTGAVTGISIGGMFLGGIVPGLTIAVGLMAVASIYARRARIPRTNPVGLAALAVAFRRALLALLTPLIILGGIVFGVVTPTEAGALAAAYAFFLGVFVYREIHARHLVGIIVAAARTTSVAVVVLAGASVFSWILARARLPTMLTDLIGSLTTDRVVAHLIIIAALLLLGTVMEATSALIIFVPFMYPVAIAFGIDPVHFGVTTALALVIGLVTPPIGMILFLASAIGDVPVRSTFRAIAPQIAVMIVVLLAAVVFPPLVTFAVGFL